jgi:hypothetical protein
VSTQKTATAELKVTPTSRRLSYFAGHRPSAVAFSIIDIISLSLYLIRYLWSLELRCEKIFLKRGGYGT